MIAAEQTEPGAAEPHAVPEQGGDEQRREPDSAIPGWRTTARAAWFVALLGALALLLGRAISPALLGVWVGVDGIVTAVQYVAATATQLFALLTLGLTVGLVLAVSRSRWPLAFRFYAVGAVCLVTLAVGSAIFLRLPELSGVAAGTAAALLALWVGWLGGRVAEARAASLIVALLGVAVAVRMGAIGLVLAAESAGSTVLEQTAGIVVTVELAVQLVAVIVAAGWLGSRTGLAMQLLARMGLVVAAGVVVWVGVRGAASDASEWAVLTNRAIGQVITVPAPLVPPVVHGFVKVLCWVVAIAILVKRWHLPAMTAAVSLAFTAQAAPEAPLLAMSLTVAALLVSAGAESARPAAPVPTPESSADPLSDAA